MISDSGASYANDIAGTFGNTNTSAQEQLRGDMLPAKVLISYIYIINIRTNNLDYATPAPEHYL